MALTCGIVCVCVCVCERERECVRGSARVCVFVCVHMPLCTCVCTNDTSFLTGISQTNADSQLNSVYKVFHRIRFCGNGPMIW